MKDEGKLTGRKKAAILLACLGPEYASKVMSFLRDAEVDRLTLDIAALGTIDPDMKAKVFEEFFQMVEARRFVSEGGIDLAKELLEKSFGTQKAIEILSRLQSSLQEVPFQFLKKADPTQISSFIQEEHPQTIALILAHLDPKVSALALTSLPPEIQADVIYRIATMDRTAPEIIREIERVLERKMAAIFTQGFTFAGGVKEVAEILNLIERSTEKSIMEKLQERDPDLANEITKLMFTFDDLIYVEDSGIQKALREIDTKDLALALKAATDEVKEKIFKNMSERAREMLKEEIEFMGPVRLRNVEEAQQRIVAVIRRLEEAGEIVISGRGEGGAEEILV